MNNDLIILFSRAPTLGKVKQRLAQNIGQEAALNVHQKLFARTIATVEKSRLEKRLYLSEAPADQFNYDYALQHGDDLGQRMAAAFQIELEQRRRVCLIGSDCLDLSVSDLELAFESLNSNDLVFGPAQDGGYYLIGMKRFIPELFEGVSWGADNVLKESLEIANSLHLKTKLLNERKDVDNYSDLPANWKEM